MAGDARSFGVWMSHAERPLRESLRSFTAAVDTESVLQECFLRVWQLAPRFVSDGRPNGLLRLALRVSRNLAVSEIRRVRRANVDVGALDEQGALATVSDAAPDPLLQQSLRACREGLPDKPAQALDARLAAQGCEADETLAERLGMKLNTFLQNFTRARKMLAECLRARGVEFAEERA